MSFSSLGLPKTILDALAENKYNKPYPIQKKAIPAILQGQDVLGIAKINPFKTNDKRVFADMLQDMNLTDLQAFAVKVGVFPAGNKTVLKNKIKRAFDASLHGKGSVQVMGEPIQLDPNNPQHKEVIDYLKG
mgnify:CR=1 FL=1